jgi:hypothetical protein
MDKIIEEGRRFASAADLQVSDMSAQAPVGTTLAILERTLKIMSAVQARIHFAMHEEFRLLKEIIRDFLPPTYDFEPEEGRPSVKQEDYDQVDVIPVSDPNAATMSQKVVQYQAVLQLAQTAPQLYDLPLLHRQMLEVLGIKNYQKLIPMEDDTRPRDPVTENMNILRGKPVKAFVYQDHQAHIMVHQMAMQDPKVQQALANNPNAQMMMAALQAHIAEHVGYEYKKQMEQVMGITIPDFEGPNEDQEIPKDMELQISQAAVQASQQLLQQHQAEAQAMQAQQQMQDPIIQMQMQELQIKQAEVQRKIAKDQADAAARMAQLEIEKQRINAQKEIAGANMAMKSIDEQRRGAKEEKMEGFRQGMDMMKMRMNAMNKPEKDNKPPAKAKK